MGEEQRRHSRIPVDTAVRYYVIGGTGRPSYELKSGVNRDASCGGVRLQVDDPIQVGSQLELEILLPVRKGSMVRRHVAVRGKVVRLDEHPGSEHPYSVGVAFTAYDEEDSVLLEAYLRSLEAEANSAAEPAVP